MRLTLKQSVLKEQTSPTRPLPKHFLLRFFKITGYRSLMILYFGRVHAANFWLENQALPAIVHLQFLHGVARIVGPIVVLDCSKDY